MDSFPTGFFCPMKAAANHVMRVIGNFLYNVFECVC